jgi:hypothetical protein
MEPARAVGAIYLQSNVNPTTDTFTSSGANGQDHYQDYAFDAGYQYLGDGNNIVTVESIFTHEHQNLKGTTTAFNVENGTTFGAGSSLNQIRVTASYWYQNTYGFRWAGEHLGTIRCSSSPPNGRRRQQQLVHHRGRLGAVRQGRRLWCLGQSEAWRAICAIRSSAAAATAMTTPDATPAPTTRCSCSLDGVLTRPAPRSAGDEAFSPWIV